MAVEFCTELADTVFQVTALFEDTKRFCGDYLSQKAPQYVITVTERDIDFERQRANQKHQKEELPPVVYSDSYLETLALYRKMAEQLVQEDVILMHGAVVAVDGQAYLFTAKSGTGKTTHIRRWLETFGDRAVVVNGDKPLLHITSEGVTAYGTPWDGKEHLSTNTSCPLKALCILTRSETNHIERISKKEALPTLCQQVYRPADPAVLAKMMALVDRLGSSVPLYRLGCNMEPEAAQVAYHGMNHE